MCSDGGVWLNSVFLYTGLGEGVEETGNFTHGLVMASISIVSNAQDLQRCFAIRRAVFVQEQNVPEEEEWDGRDAECTHFLAFSDATVPEPVGTARLCEYEDGSAKIQRVAVLSHARRAGVGRLLMTAVEQEAVRRGFDAVHLSAQTTSIPFYERLGYLAFGDVFDDAGIPHRNMEKKVGASQ